jgi:hypothetical protein
MVMLNLTQAQYAGLIFAYKKGRDVMGQDARYLLDCVMDGVLDKGEGVAVKDTTVELEPILLDKPATPAKAPKPAKEPMQIVPTLAEMEGTAGWVVARMIDLAADGLVASAIHRHLCDWIATEQDVTEALEHYAEKIQMCKSFSNQKDRQQYLAGVAVGRNKRDDERKIKAAKP